MVNKDRNERGQVMPNDVSRKDLEHRKKYHAREQEKARRKIAAWAERFDMHAKAHWECTKRLIEEERADEMAKLDAAVDEENAAFLSLSE